MRSAIIHRDFTPGNIRLRSDDEDNEKIVSSLRSLNRHVQKHRLK